MMTPTAASADNQRKRTTKRNLVIFTIVVIAIGWIGWGLDTLMGNQAAESLGMLLWIIAPFTVSLLLRAFAGDGWKDLGIRPRLKENAAWYGVAILIFPIVAILCLLIGRVSGMVAFPNFSLNTIGLLLQAFVLGLLPMFFKNILEEFAWRGYLAPQFHSLIRNDFAGHLLVGLIWGAWHIPYYLFFLDRSVIQGYTSLNLAAFIPMAIVTMISWAIVFGEIRLLTHSVWPAVLMHMVEDAFLNQLLLDGHVQIVPGTDWLISPGIGVVNIITFTAIGIVLWRLRKRKESVSPKNNPGTVSGAICT